LIRNHHLEHRLEADSALIEWVQRVGRERFHELIALRRADFLACGLHIEVNALNGFQEKVAALIAARRVLAPADLAVGGQAVMRTLGLLPGPQVGRILRELLVYAREHPSRNNEEALTSRLLEMKGRNDGGPGENDTRRA
jgi:tRNA nucleotidyltransferase (CCA-adding enzyme)